jgi:cobaltochelatase CobT subunit
MIEVSTETGGASVAGAYRIYTTQFDLEVRANHIDAALGPLSAEDEKALDQAWHALQTGLLPWKTRLLILAAEASIRIRERLARTERYDTAISLLIDQSGSMRGQKMLFAAATADIAQEFLETLGVACEVLGFTTSQWRGGRSRKRWKWHLRPRQPGRLNDVLHIVYRSADDHHASIGGYHLRSMLRPDLPKENIDGEALLWAAKRLRALPQSRKHLIVLSDGAPVDDSTLLANGLTYLSDHLRLVVNAIVQAGDIDLSAICIGHETDDIYPNIKHVEAPDEMGAAAIAHLEQALTGKKQSA